MYCIPMYGRVVPSMVGVVPSYTVEYNAACTVWCGMQNQNVKTCRMKFRGSDSDFDWNEWIL